MVSDCHVRLKKPHAKQKEFLWSLAKRKIIRAGRRAGKTTAAAILAVLSFLTGRRVLYGAPTEQQVDRFWTEVCRSLAEPIRSEAYRKNEGERVIELLGSEQRIKAKTMWNADTARGDYADLLILDEWQLMNEDVWGVVAAPMLVDRGGRAVFIYTPPSLHSTSTSKAQDPRHASRMFAMAEIEMKKAAAEGRPSRWAAFHFTSFDNPHLSQEGLLEVSQDMTNLAYRQEILAQDINEVPGALWTRQMLERNRMQEHPELDRIGIGVDPPGGVGECGIVVAGIGLCRCNGKEETHAFVLEDASLSDSPDAWAKEVARCYRRHKADRVYGEKNYGGDMVESTIRTVDRLLSYENVTATRGKAVRAEPIAALYEQQKVHHIGALPKLEDEQCLWIPGQSRWSPNRIDALVWVLTRLMLGREHGNS